MNLVHLKVAKLTFRENAESYIYRENKKGKTQVGYYPLWYALTFLLDDCLKGPF